MLFRLAQLLAVVVIGAAAGFYGLGASGRPPLPAAPPRGAESAPALAEPLPITEDVAADGDDTAAAPLAEAERRNREAVALAAANDLAGAAALLREAVRLEPGEDLYRRNLQAVLINAGFGAIEQERFDAAAGSFAEALRLGDRSEVRRGLGYAYYRLGKLDLARISLERALEQDAGDPETFLTLGRIYLEKRDHARARAMFERALAAGADHPGLAETLAHLQRDARAEEGFHALASSHFVLKFEGRENTQAGRLVLNALEEAYRVVGARFSYYPLEPIEVVLYPDETFRTVTNSPHWSSAVYDGRIKMPIGGLERGSERLRRTFRHEYAHAAIVTLSRSRAPVWLNEGLAQVAEQPEVDGRLQRLRLGLAENALLPLTDLEGDFTALDRGQASLAYAQAYFAAAYLLDQKGSYNVRRLLEALATADSVDAAFRAALGVSYAEFEGRVLAEIERAVG